MRIRRTLGLILAAATLAGAGAVGAVSAQAASSPTITRQECTDAGGQIKSIPYGGDTCTLPDGTSQRIT
ncbi:MULTISPECIES: hypothetical protein [Streptomyces]|uniref:hypothetical protein n=1 Tax=Streptomyces TaxID=1883 RepID=UPI0006AE4675|nr:MULTISPECIES: hypothetical protein [unclassified Streptomyces]KOU89267.1 hypothetical protein ADK61_00545 [Streptomyces sp. XY66]KOU90051.1 hypothetical protein ADK93_09920 [Streptomyces sp. XY58]KOV12740.1 hypothetical protein ADK89_00375 [Streptomyces sp. XY37]KOV20092.1 hypothetical protein ADK90_14250 [Streptomyces sp. XY413]KOV56707.1 hypothetical protein ADK99_01695 [Streptomyces sp. MMG1064]